MQADDPSVVDAARRRLAQKSRFRLFPSMPNLRSKYKSSTGHPLRVDPFGRSTTDAEDTHAIVLDSVNLPHLLDDRDVYRWAVVYENQRGISIFSSPYYSRLSLLPTDPPAFTIPLRHAKDVHQPNVSLANYPLPDGTWRWVSKSWMIDMRTDLGEVQHDGFEYNWSFREKHWHAEIGSFSAGAWVRRRRWVRLMMRPAKPKYGLDSSHEGSLVSNTTTTSRSELHAAPSSSIVSLVHPGSEIALEDLKREAVQVWEGDEQDWQRCHRLLKLLGRDGRKLELWRMWLGPYVREVPPDVKDNGGDSFPEACTSEEGLPPFAHLASMLRNHRDTILRSFVFPDSRAQFLNLLERAGLADDMGRKFTASYADFWSYSSGLEKVVNDSN
ncbi:hypothetical protein F5I97DRAFT_2064875 [Phlebopus sp. FC_14]|nr:hypothetical protein F5I97DRAFT_2064875 [Phlebopus sp. FC_14]